MKKGWDLRTSLAAVLAFIGSLILLTVLTTQDIKARSALGVFIALVTFLALPGRYVIGQCSRCGAKPNKQISKVLTTAILPISQANSGENNIEFNQGWDVRMQLQTNCTVCKSTIIESRNEFVSKKDAPSQSEAIILAQKDLYIK